MRKVLIAAIVLISSSALSQQQSETFSNYFQNLPSATLPLAGTEPMLVLQGGVSKQVPSNTLLSILSDPLFNTTSVDGSTWTSGFSKIGQQQSAAGTAVAGSANQQALVVQAYVPVTAAAADYEKVAIISYCATVDPSTGGVTRDCVGGDFRGYALPGNTTARVWGTNPQAQIQSGADGLAQAEELDVLNNGTDQSAVDTTTSKYGLTIVPLPGSNPSTAAIYIEGGSPLQTWHNGIFAHTQAVSGNFIALDSLFTVDNKGNLAAGNTTVNATGVALAIQGTNSGGEVKSLVSNFSAGVGSVADSVYASNVANGTLLVGVNNVGPVGVIQGGSALGEMQFITTGSTPFVFAPNNSIQITIAASGGLSVGTSSDPGAGNVYVAGSVSATSYKISGVSGVSCVAGTVSTATLAISNGIVTHC